MKTKKWLAVVFVACMAFAGQVQTAQAAETKQQSQSARKTAEDMSKVFKSQELVIGGGYALATEDFDNYRESVLVGADYFVTRGAGVHAEIGLRDLDDQAIDRVAFGLAGRIPFDKLRLALNLGVGAQYDFVNSRPSRLIGDEERKTVVAGRCDEWAVYAEVGPSFRPFKYLDVFAKVRGVRPVKGAAGEHVAIIAGVQIPLEL